MSKQRDDSCKLQQYGQQQRRHINAGKPRNHPPQGNHQRIGHPDYELADRVVEVGAHQLQQKTQQHGDQVQAEQGLHQIDQNFVDRAHAVILSRANSGLAHFPGHFGGASRGSAEGVRHQLAQAVVFEAL